MTLTVSRTDTVLSRGSRATHLRDVAGAIAVEALALAQGKLTPKEQRLPAETLFRRRDFLDSFKYNLAKGVAAELAAHDRRVLEVYQFDSPTNPDVENGNDLPVDGNIRLLVVVEAPSAALNAFIQALDRTLAGCLEELRVPFLAGRSSVLNVAILSEEEKKQGTGYAGLLSAVFFPPLRLV